MISFKCPACGDFAHNVNDYLEVGEDIDLYCAGCNRVTLKLVISEIKPPIKEKVMKPHFLTAQTSLLSETGRKLAIINPREIVELTGNTADGGRIREVIYISSTGTEYKGWIESVLSEPFVSTGDIIKIDSPTVYRGDAAQYLIYLGAKQYNLCGEFSVLYCAQWLESSIEEWLDEWKSKHFNDWNLVFSNKYSRTTGITQLEQMFQTFEGYTEKFERLTESFYLPERKRPHFTPGRLRTFLLDNRAIVGVKISTYTGRLQKSGTPHWVVLEAISTYQQGGLVTLYNPFSNSLEEYSWEEVYASVTGTPYGIAVPRN